MSRIGTKPVEVPAGVTATVSGRTVTAKGPKGELSRALPEGVSVRLEDGKLHVAREGDDAAALHGLSRALLQGMVEGVSKGFEKRLEIVGVSYQAKISGRTLTLQIGFSHPVVFEVPAGIAVECPQPTLVVVRGADKQAVGQFAAEVRRARPPEPYKGKGVRYVGEAVIQKAGKTFVSGEK
jgi:large subunit ribosomal protein L6